MKIFAQIVGTNIIKFIDAPSADHARLYAIAGYDYDIVDITDATKCESFRQYGRIYDKKKNLVLPSKTFRSWVLDAKNATWKPPIDRPNEFAIWDENSRSWS
jgi:hypothetical protein